MSPSGIESATLRLVAQCLSQLRHRVPLHLEVKDANYEVANYVFFSNVTMLPNASSRDLDDAVTGNVYSVEW